MTAKEQFEILKTAFAEASNSNYPEAVRLMGLLTHDEAVVYLDTDAVPSIQFTHADSRFKTIWKAKESL